jgi:hypothetical protein
MTDFDSTYLPSVRIGSVGGAAEKETDPAANKMQGLAWFEIERVATPLLNQIDKNHQGAVTRQQVSDALTDPKYAGEQAQVLAGLYTKFKQVSVLGGGDGQTISNKTPEALYHTFYDSEKQASQLIALDNWTSAHFSQLDRAGKGYINQSDVTGALANYSGAEKNMIDALDANFDKFSQTGRVTARDVTNYVDRFLTSDSALTFTDSFEEAMRRTSIAQSNTVPHDVFSDPLHPEESIQAAAVKQGFPNDCSFNAPMAALAQQRPSDIKNMISKNPDGSFKVSFPGADHPVKVSAPSAAEQGVLDAATKSGFWPTLLEKAYGQLKIDADPQMQSAHLSAEDILDHRGPLKEAIEMLTGHQAAEIFLRDTSKASLVNILQDSLTNGSVKVVTLGTGSTQERGSTKDGFALNHGFSVLAYWPAGAGDGQVVVRDTYGLGGANNDGVSTISVQQLKDNFTDIVYEK